jgi:hypothetical protein
MHMMAQCISKVEVFVSFFEVSSVDLWLMRLLAEPARVGLTQTQPARMQAALTRSVKHQTTLTRLNESKQ